MEDLSQLCEVGLWRLHPEERQVQMLVHFEVLRHLVSVLERHRQGRHGPEVARHVQLRAEEDVEGESGV